MPKYYLSIASIFKNESHILKEWIEHHKFHGVDHIYLVDDFSTDNYLEILQKYIDEGYVTLFINKISKRYCGRQIEINNTYFKQILNDTQWIAQIDLDEFIYSPNHLNIKDVIKKYENYSGLVLNWAYFGSSGFEKQPKYVVESFLKRCDYNAKTFVKHPGHPKGIISFNASKTISNTSYNIKSFNIHTIDTDGNQINISHEKNDELLINHYQLQSKEYWINIKSKRNSDVNDWFVSSDINYRNIEEYNVMDSVCTIIDDRLYNQNKILFG